MPKICLWNSIIKGYFYMIKVMLKYWYFLDYRPTEGCNFKVIFHVGIILLIYGNILVQLLKVPLTGILCTINLFSRHIYLLLLKFISISLLPNAIKMNFQNWIKREYFHTVTEALDNRIWIQMHKMLDNAMLIKLEINPK